MGHQQLASNSMVFDDRELTETIDTPHFVTVSIFPTSADTGLVTIFARQAVLLTLTTEDTRALRDRLTLALEQAEGGHPFQTV